MKLQKILKETGVKSTIPNWTSECENFQEWYKKLGGNISSNIDMAKAYLKIEPKINYVDSLELILKNQ